MALTRLDLESNRPDCKSQPGKQEMMDMRSVKIRTAAIRSLIIIFAIILSTTVIAASPKCRSSDFACFKRKMMPQVGRKITVKGMLASAKLGRIVMFDHWGIYVYARHESDSDRMKSLDAFNSQSVKVTGILRYTSGSATQRTNEASIPEHFFFDVAEVQVSGATRLLKSHSGKCVCENLH